MKPILNSMLILIIALVIISMPLKGINQSEKKEKEVLEVLKKFQAGYDQRGMSKLNEFVEEIFDPEDVLVIGINSSAFGDSEWCLGIDAVKRLIAVDWRVWADLKMKMDNARIMIEGNTSWISVYGTSERRFQKKEEYDRVVRRILNYIEMNKDKEQSPVILLSVLKIASRHMWEYERGNEDFIHPIRITGVLVKKEGKWRFRQMQFSFPMQGIPVVRIIKDHENQ